MKIQRLIREDADVIARDITGLDIKTASIYEAAGHDRVVWPIPFRPAMSLVQHPKAHGAADHEQGECAGQGAQMKTHLPKR